MYKYWNQVASHEPIIKEQTERVWLCRISSVQCYDFMSWSSEIIDWFPKIIESIILISVYSFQDHEPSPLDFFILSPATNLIHHIVSYKISVIALWLNCALVTDIKNLSRSFQELWELETRKITDKLVGSAGMMGLPLCTRQPIMASN